jgi:hypothetical protein
MTQKREIRSRFWIHAGTLKDWQSFDKSDCLYRTVQSSCHYSEQSLLNLHGMRCANSCRSAATVLALPRRRRAAAAAGAVRRLHGA